MTEVQGGLDAGDARFGIVLSRFNELVGDQLLSGAIETLTRHGVDPARVDVVRVPGAFEIPLALQALARTARYDALIALGVVIRGETPHFEYIAGECARGVREVSLAHGLPVAFGVLTTNTLEQALERAGGRNQSNKGADAALVAMEMAGLVKRLRA